MKKKLIAVALIALPLAFTGCSASPLEAGIDECQDRLQYEIEQVKPQPTAGWLDSNLSADVTSTEPRDGSEYAHDITGTATVELSDGTNLTVEWECFTQTADGNTFAAVHHIDGECTRTFREASPDDCG